MLVTILVLAILAGGSYRIAEPILARQRIESFLREAATLMHRARVEAIRLGTPVVVRVDPESRLIEVFADFSDTDGNPGSDLLFEPENDGPVPLRTVDYRIALLPLPDSQIESRQIQLWGVADSNPWGATSTDGFTEDPRSTEDNPRPPIAVFEPDGSVRDVGAFRFGMGPLGRTERTDGNFYEIRVAPAASALVELRKFVVHDPDSLSGYYPRDSTPGKAGWTWY